MGSVMISLKEDDEKLLRELARSLGGGKKGAISAVVSAGIEELAKKQNQAKSAKAQLELMRKGFNFGLKGRKAFENRGDLYD